MADSNDLTLVLTYDCEHCGAELEAGNSSWSAWRLCPVCKQPSPEPRPAWNDFAGASDPFFDRTKGFDAAGTNASRPPQGLSSIQDRYGWLDAVVPPPLGQTTHVTAPRPTEPTRPTTSKPSASEDGVAWVEPLDDLTVRPLPLTPSSSIPPELQKAMSALSRPAHVPGMGQPPYAYGQESTKGSGGRVFLGIALCVSTVGALFQLLDESVVPASVFGASALICLLLLARPGQRRRQG